MQKFKRQTGRIKLYTPPEGESTISSIHDKCWINKQISRVLERVSPNEDVSCRNLSSVMKHETRRIFCSLLFVLLSRMSLSFPTGDNYHKLIKSLLFTFNQIDIQEETTAKRSFVQYHVQLLKWKAVRAIEDPPIEPKGIIGKNMLFDGYLKRYISIAHARKDISFFESLLQCKRTWDKITVKKRQVALESNRKNLSKEFCEPLNNRIRKHIYSQVHELAKGFDKRATSFTPSGSACLEEIIPHGGCGALFEPFRPPTDEQIRSWGRSPLSGRFYPINPQMLIAFFEEHREDQLIQNHEKAIWKNQINYTNMKEIFEPNKARIIGVQSGHDSSQIQSFQGQALDLWKRSKASTMNEEFEKELIDGFGTTSLPLIDSIDYPSATDTMNPESCIVGLDSYLDVIDIASLGIDRESFLTSFVTSRVRYPEKFLVVNPDNLEGKTVEADLEPIIQKYGQRMGDRRSFFVLCIVNLAVFLAAVEYFFELAQIGGLKTNSAIMIKKSMMRTLKVNGDDVVFACPLNFHQIWKEFALNIGWTLSPGKSYLSPIYAQINSRNFIRKGPGYPIKRIGYLNMKLVTGFNLKKNGSADADPEQMGRDLSAMVNLCPWTDCMLSKTFARFDKIYNKDYKPNWFLPVHLGGYGVDKRLCEKESIVYTLKQRKVASHLISNPKLHLTKKILDPAFLESRAGMFRALGQEVPPYIYTSRWVENLIPPVRFMKKSEPLLDYDDSCKNNNELVLNKNVTTQAAPNNSVIITEGEILDMKERRVKFEIEYDLEGKKIKKENEKDADAHSSPIGHKGKTCINLIKDYCGSDSQKNNTDENEENDEEGSVMPDKHILLRRNEMFYENCNGMVYENNGISSDEKEEIDYEILNPIAFDEITYYNTNLNNFTLKKQLDPNIIAKITQIIRWMNIANTTQPEEKKLYLNTVPKGWYSCEAMTDETIEEYWEPVFIAPYGLKIPDGHSLYTSKIRPYFSKYKKNMKNNYKANKLLKKTIKMANDENKDMGLPLTRKDDYWLQNLMINYDVDDLQLSHSKFSNDYLQPYNYLQKVDKFYWDTSDGKVKIQEDLDIREEDKQEYLKSKTLYEDKDRFKLLSKEEKADVIAVLKQNDPGFKWNRKLHYDTHKKDRNVDTFVQELYNKVWDKTFPRELL